VTYSPDGRFCAVGGDDGAVHVFDAHTWQRIAHLPEELHSANSTKHITISNLDYSPDGVYPLAVIASEVNLGTGTVEFAVEVWDTSNWGLCARLDDFSSTVNDLSLLPDRSILVATDEGLRRYAKRQSYTTILPTNIHRVAASPDGRYAVVGYHSFDGHAALLDLENGEVDGPLPAITQEMVNSVAFLSDSQHYLVCHNSYWLRQVGRKTAVKRLPAQDVISRNRPAAAASSRGHVAIVSWERTISVLWGSKFEHVIPPHPGARRRLNAVAFARMDSKSRQQVASTSEVSSQRIAEGESLCGSFQIWSCASSSQSRTTAGSRPSTGHPTDV